MLALLVAASIAGQLPAGIPDTRGWWRGEWRTGRAWGRSGAGFAFFEFAPVGGAGMGTACACAAVTGAKGETVTVTRTGNATCSKQGLATTGIADGDLVVCGSNLPRVEASGGVLGLCVEGARENRVLRNEEFDNPAWQRFGIINAPTPAYAPSVRSGATATRVEVTTCAGTASVLFQDYTGTAATWTASIYLRGTSGSGTISLYYFDTTATAGNAVQCNFVSTEWRRCSITRAFANTTHRVGIGCQNAASVTGNANTGGADFLAALAQSEPGAYATSPIPTTSGAVTRNADAVTATLSPNRTDTTICLAATLEPQWTTSGQVPAFGTVVGRASPISLISFPSGAARMFTSAGATGAFAAGLQRLIGRDNNTNVTISINGTVTSAAAGSAADRWTTALDIGSGASGAAIDGIITRVQADPDANRCSP